MPREFGAGAIVRDDFRHGCGRNCTLYGNNGVLHNGDGAVIYGNHWVVFCADPASITDHGRNNCILRTAELDVARYYTHNLGGGLRYRKRPLPRRVTLVWRGTVIAVYDERRAHLT